MILRGSSNGQPRHDDFSASEGDDRHHSMPTSLAPISRQATSQRPPKKKNNKANNEVNKQAS